MMFYMYDVFYGVQSVYLVYPLVLKTRIWLNYFFKPHVF